MASNKQTRKSTPTVKAPLSVKPQEQTAAERYKVGMTEVVLTPEELAELMEGAEGEELHQRLMREQEEIEAIYDASAEWLEMQKNDPRERARIARLFGRALNGEDQQPKTPK